MDESDLRECDGLLRLFPELPVEGFVVDDHGAIRGDDLSPLAVLQPGVERLPADTDRPAGRGDIVPFLQHGDDLRLERVIELDGLGRPAAEMSALYVSH